ncbi:aldolase/citrate lyase family protein [Bacteroides fragilis]
MSHLFRSLMFVPAHNERLLNSASRSDADVLILDIEDSVQPVSNKIVARNNIVKYISGNIFF